MSLPDRYEQWGAGQRIEPLRKPAMAVQDLRRFGWMFLLTQGDVVEELFRLIRMPFLPLPLVLWSVLWPLLLSATIVVAMPLKFIGTTVIYGIGSLFVLLGAAWSNEPERIRAYLDNWCRVNENTMSMANHIKVARGYSRIFAWGHDPKTVADTGWIIGTANVVGLILIGAVISEMIRTALGIGLVIAVILIVLGLVTGE